MRAQEWANPAATACTPLESVATSTSVLEPAVEPFRPASDAWSQTPAPDAFSATVAWAEATTGRPMAIASSTLFWIPTP